MDLRSGCIYWLETDATRIPAPPLDQDAHCDVAIIGGGITGAMCAYEMTRNGVDVVLLDRRELCHGSTAASTGLLQFEIDTPLSKLRALVGREHADRAYRLCVEAVKSFEPLVEDLDDRCDLIARDSLYLACDPDDVDQLRIDHDARRSIGIEVEFLDSRALADDYGINRPAALRSRPAAEVDPYRLSLALVRRSISRGLRAFASTQVDGYEADDTGVTLRTSLDRRVRARRVIFATGYETPEFFPRDICMIKSTYALAGDASTDLKSWRDRCLIWESGSPYFYARATREQRVMIGGEDEDFADAAARDALIPQKARALVGKFNTLFPSIQLDPQCAWAGTFAQTKDGLPYIGAAREFRNGYFALGYGGNGIVFGLIAARIIRDLFLRRRNADVEIFRFDR